MGAFKRAKATITAAEELQRQATERRELSDLIAAWRTDVDSEPMPQLVDVGTAVFIIRGGSCMSPLTCDAVGCQKLCYAGTGQPS